MFSGPLDRDTFLRDYWQRRPVLLRAALPDFTDPLSPEELAGLACEEAAESRIIRCRNDAWELANGPFGESDFTGLPESGWTLLVQGVDQWFPRVKSLLSLVDFLPQWRVDDVMVSYAEAGGGVGPHFDYYDVFIVQGQGSRTWRIGQHCDSSTPLRADGGLKILESFTAREEWRMHSGDVLYIPPGIAHYGVSADASLSYSIGFRAPSMGEILLGHTDEIAAGLSQDQRYRDSGAAAAEPGEIPTATVARLQAMVERTINEHPRALALWFGKHMSEPKYPEYFPEPDPVDLRELRRLVREHGALATHPAARFYWQARDDELLFFADGRAFAFPAGAAAPARLVRRLAAAPAVLAPDEFLDDPDCLVLLCELYNQGSLTLPEQES